MARTSLPFMTRTKFGGSLRSESSKSETERSTMDTIPRTEPKEQKIAVSYHGVLIAYDHHKDRWEFTLRGFDRWAPTLGKAKEAIDRLPPKKYKPFKRIKVWVYNPCSPPDTNYLVAELTSVIADTCYGSYGQAWVSAPSSEGKTERSKVHLSSIYPCNPANDALIERIEALSKRMVKLEEDRSELRGKLKWLEVKPESADDNEA